MSKTENSPVHLRRIDPAQNMRRFYTLAIQPTLFGGATVIRNWGRIGTNGQTMMETFDQPEDAGSARDRIERAKRRRGYRDAGRDGQAELVRRDAKPGDGADVGGALRVGRKTPP